MKRRSSDGASRGTVGRGGPGRKTVLFESGSTASRPGSSKNKGGSSSPPTTRLSKALNAQADSVTGDEWSAKRKAARVAASERAAARRAAAVHAEQR
eukprot:6186783-Pleurochrysis_carterae.AAC.2